DLILRKYYKDRVKNLLEMLFEQITILIKKLDNSRDNQIFPTYLSTLTKGFGDGVPSPMGERPRVGDRRKGMREIGVWGASPPKEVMDLI
ncbi:MAG: hypothetical protein AB4372_19245, partial [Xenococcus sp. (in: cyanobacteria)]